MDRSQSSEAGAPPARRSSPLVAPALLIFWLGLGWALATLPAPPGLLSFAFVVVGWILAVALHEFGHAWTAWRAGDHTVATKGYLTLDPRLYADLGTSLVIPLLALALGGIGFPGGAVYLREDLMRSRVWRSAASLAGPFATLLVLLLLAAVLAIFASPFNSAGAPLVDGLAFLAFLQATALVLNLLPVPGFDGYGAIRPFLPKGVRRGLRRFEGMAAMGFLLLIFFVPGASAVILAPALALMGALGVSGEMIRAGWDAFRFWR